MASDKFSPEQIEEAESLFNIEQAEFHPSFISTLFTIHFIRFIIYNQASIYTIRHTSPEFSFITFSIVSLILSIFSFVIL